jgi:hypothetical protein
MTTITKVSMKLGVNRFGDGSGDDIPNSEKMDIQQVELIIPTPDALYAILDEDDAIKITEVSLHSICDGAWTIVDTDDKSNSESFAADPVPSVAAATYRTYTFVLNVDVRHIGTISESAVAKISDTIFKNARAYPLDARACL